MSATTIDLLTMNEDCVRQILKLLDLMDLCAVAETCMRLREIAQRISPKKLFVLRKRNGEYQVANHDRTRNDINRIFKNFGPILTKIEISGTLQNYEECVVLGLTTKHCDKHLKKLVVQVLTIPDILAVRLKPTFKRLQKLHLCNTNLNNDPTVFAGLDELVELDVSSVENDSSILKNKFVKLERFLYEKHEIVTGDSVNEQYLPLPAFLSLHNTLKTLDFITLKCDDSYKVTVLQVIGDNLKDLEELHITCWLNEALLHPLESLKSLETLTLANTNLKSFDFVLPLTALRELTLEHCDLPNDFNQFTALAQLTKLDIEEECTSAVDVASLISVLPNLKEMSIYGLYHTDGNEFILDQNTFSKIADVVKERLNVLTLKCNSNFKVNEICDGNQKIKLLGFYD